MRISFTDNTTGLTRRAILHREFENGEIMISYMVDNWGRGGQGSFELRRYVTLAPWHFTGVTLL